MFIRVFKPQEMKEVLINLNHVRKIEVSYTVEGGWRTSLQHGIPDPNAQRFYTLFIGDEQFNFQREPDGGNDPILDAIEKIYKDAIKGPSERPPSGDPAAE